MAARELEVPIGVARPPRAMAWVLLLASAFAVFVIGLLGTALVVGNLGAWPSPTRRAFWPQLLWACALTVASLALRSLRWIFLLRRAETRIPIRDAYIGYFAGLSLLFAPFLLGEIAVRAAINRRRARVPVTTTVVVNLWERLGDVAAVGIIAATAGLAAGEATTWNYFVLAFALMLFISPMRRLALRAIVPIVQSVTRTVGSGNVVAFERLAATRTWLVALAAGIGAWILPAVGFWLIARVWGVPFPFASAEHAYATSATLSGLALAPGGVLIAGRHLLAALSTHGFPESAAVVAVVAVRLATVGVSVVLGGVFVLAHLRTAPARSENHFDDIADAYDVQIPESRRHALLDRKTRLMQEAIARMGIGRRGLDVGCGQGAYVVRMRELGFDVQGIDASAGQVQLAAKNLGATDIVTLGSALHIPAADGTYDFLYVINVLHHLPTVDDQRRAFNELFRVLKPGGLLFVHEINTRNILFRFYMGYVFPSLNCIDEGVERWLLPHRLNQYTDAVVVDIRYFTFLPDFIPQSIARLLQPIERALESSPFGPYSAHYMAVLRREPQPS